MRAYSQRLLWGDLGLFASLWNSRMPMDRKEDLEDAISPVVFVAEKVEIWGYVKDGMVGWHNRWFYP